MQAYAVHAPAHEDAGGGVPGLVEQGDQVPHEAVADGAPGRQQRRQGHHEDDRRRRGRLGGQRPLPDLLEHRGSLSAPAGWPLRPRGRHRHGHDIPSSGAARRHPEHQRDPGLPPEGVR
ncbi:hypothetical protein [Ornithinimicrobium kibberense]|uniref:hypothetical protein n=1 Tax=Ornithinimicrobium kibberense TaxID=282060 RepID=UPI00361C6106